MLFYVLLLLLTLLPIYHSFPVNGFGEIHAFDDALMYYRYGFNIVEHGVFGWNLEPSYGCTSTLYTFIVSLGVLFNKATGYSFHPETVVLSVNYVIYLLLATVLTWTVFRTELKTGFKYILSFVFLLSFPALAMAGSGMETSLAALMLIFYYHSFQKWKVNERRTVGLALIAYLCFASRPESLLFLGVLHLVDAIASRYGRVQIIRLAKLGFMLVGILLIESGIKYLYFGYVLPLPYYVKQGEFYDGELLSHLYRSSYTLYLSVLYTLPVLFLLMMRKNRVALPIIISFAAISIYLLTVNQIMGMGARFAAPYIAVLWFAAFYHWKTDSDNDKSEYWKSPSKLFLGFGLILSSFVLVKIYDVKKDNLLRSKDDELLRENHEYAVDKKFEEMDIKHLPYSWFAESAINLDDDIVLAAGEHGLLAALNPEKEIIDYMGLHNEEIAFGADILSTVLDKKPDMIHMPHPHNITMRKKFVDAMKSEESEYIFLKDAWILGVGVRKDSDFKDEILKELQELQEQSNSR